VRHEAASCLLNALLAQLVEHFHGKEGVAGSSPAEGFKNRAMARFSCFRSGSDDHFRGTKEGVRLDALDGVTPVEVDLAPPSAPAALIRRTTEEHGRVDVLVNNVGAVRLRLDGFLAIDDEEFERPLQLNFFIALRASRAALAAMMDHGGGAIVNVASINAFFQPDGGVVDYGAAKAALVNLTRRWRRSSARAACG
jgi:NAD(P)-dependent dehydrogenase (short-subunit alcohol dehydrogenase family)